MNNLNYIFRKDVKKYINKFNIIITNVSTHYKSVIGVTHITHEY
jgi:hypothetical protein